MDSSAYKISLTIPERYKDVLMDTVNNSMERIHPGYDRVFSVMRAEGTWRSLEGSNPYSGEIGKITIDNELRIDFVVKAKDLKGVIQAIKGIHPYEEPAIDVMPIIPWKDLIDL